MVDLVIQSSKPIQDSPVQWLFNDTWWMFTTRHLVHTHTPVFPFPRRHRSQGQLVRFTSFARSEIVKPAPLRTACTLISMWGLVKHIPGRPDSPLVTLATVKAHYRFTHKQHLSKFINRLGSIFSRVNEWIMNFVPESNIIYIVQSNSPMQGSSPAVSHGRIQWCNECLRPDIWYTN